MREGETNQHLSFLRVASPIEILHPKLFDHKIGCMTFILKVIKKTKIGTNPREVTLSLLGNYAISLIKIKQF